jgi:TRAP-type C4-dicarboxylate transport system permease small subunit
MEINPYFHAYQAYMGQVEELMVYLFLAGLALSIGWIVLPVMFPEKRQRIMEIIYTASIALACLVLGAMVGAGI